jgi:hypothetical protein
LFCLRPVYARDTDIARLSDLEYNVF